MATEVLRRRLKIYVSFINSTYKLKPGQPLLEEGGFSVSLKPENELSSKEAEETVDTLAAIFRKVSTESVFVELEETTVDPEGEIKFYEALDKSKDCPKQQNCPKLEAIFNEDIPPLKEEKSKPAAKIICYIVTCQEEAIGKAWFREKRAWYPYCRRHLELSRKDGYLTKLFSDTDIVSGDDSPLILKEDPTWPME